MFNQKGIKTNLNIAKVCIYRCNWTTQCRYSYPCFQIFFLVQRTSCFQAYLLALKFVRPSTSIPSLTSTVAYNEHYLSNTRPDLLTETKKRQSGIRNFIFDCIYLPCNVWTILLVCLTRVLILMSLTLFKNHIPFPVFYVTFFIPKITSSFRLTKYSACLHWTRLN